MISVITAVLAGSAAGLAVTAASEVAALVVGALVAVAVLILMMRYQRSEWLRAGMAFSSDSPDALDG